MIELIYIFIGILLGISIVFLTVILWIVFMVWRNIEIEQEQNTKNIIQSCE